MRALLLGPADLDFGAEGYVALYMVPDCSLHMKWACSQGKYFAAALQEIAGECPICLLDVGSDIGSNLMASCPRQFLPADPGAVATQRY